VKQAVEKCHCLIAGHGGHRDETADVKDHGDDPEGAPHAVNSKPGVRLDWGGMRVHEIEVHAVSVRFGASSNTEGGNRSSE
jgi:hypothetical protein